MQGIHFVIEQYDVSPYPYFGALPDSYLHLIPTFVQMCVLDMLIITCGLFRYVDNIDNEM
jgi:hypothetical protein